MASASQIAKKITKTVSLISALTLAMVTELTGAPQVDE
jgi:hypothetical protein